MKSEPQPNPSLETRVGLRYDDLKPFVRSYVDKLHAQIDAILHKYGVKNPQEFSVKMKEKGSKIKPEERQRVIELVGALIEAYRTDETPHTTLEQAQEILGRENVHSIEDVEFTLGFTVDPDKIPPIPYTLEDLQKSKEIKEKTGVEEMLVLFVADVDGKPLTGERLNDLIQKKYTEMGLGKFLYNTDWYKNNEDFFNKSGLTYSWKLITKQTIPDSKNKRHHFEPGDDQRADSPFTHKDTQEYAIEQFAENIEIPKDKLHRPEPFEMLYAVAVHLCATERDQGKEKGERLLKNEYHWSNIISSDGYFVHVGHADADGAYVDSYSRHDWPDRLGACLSRDSF